MKIIYEPTFEINLPKIFPSFSPQQSNVESSSTQNNSFVTHQVPLTDYPENIIYENVEWDSYKKYLKSISSSKCGVLWLMIIFVCAQLNTSGLEFFIAKW